LKTQTAIKPEEVHKPRVRGNMTQTKCLKDPPKHSRKLI